MNNLVDATTCSLSRSMDCRIWKMWSYVRVTCNVLILSVRAIFIVYAWPRHVPFSEKVDFGKLPALIIRVRWRIGRPLIFFPALPFFGNLGIQSESLARHNFRRARSLLECDEIKWSKCVLVPTRASSRTAATASCSFIPLRCCWALSLPPLLLFRFSRSQRLCWNIIAMRCKRRLPCNMYTCMCTYAYM